MEEHSWEPCLEEWLRTRGEKQLEQSLEVKQHQEENWGKKGKKRVTSLVGQKSLQGERMEIVLEERQHQEGSSKEKTQ